MHHTQLLRHRCSWPGCAKLVPLSMWGCSAHWFALPQTLRVRIGRAYREGIDTDMHPTREYVRAHRLAMDWIAHHEAFKAIDAREAARAHTSEDEAQGANDARRDLP